MKVSAFILTYNHARFIGQAIEGFLSQRTDFPCELVIADDCSTDGTQEVIRRYWEKDRDHIRVLLNRHNIGAWRTFPRAYEACRGQYVALVEGDDYWTAPDKLQRQVDLLDRHPDCTICFHSVRMVWEDGSRDPILYRPQPVKERYTLRDLVNGNFIGSCSTMYRRGVFGGFPAWYYSMPVGDWCHHILHARHGDIVYLDEPMAVYRQHGGGIYSMKPAVHRLRIAVETLRRLRCVLPREVQAAVNASLCQSYCALIHQYGDEGKQAEARQCLTQCWHEVRPSLHLPLGELLKAASRACTPSLHKLCKQMVKRIPSATDR